jgi:hypothetical protein
MQPWEKEIFYGCFWFMILIYVNRRNSNIVFFLYLLYNKGKNQKRQGGNSNATATSMFSLQRPAVPS